jgi:hypothetical protein
MGDKELALEHIKEALKYEPDNPALIEHFRMVEQSPSDREPGH